MKTEHWKFSKKLFARGNWLTVGKTIYKLIPETLCEYNSQ